MPRLARLPPVSGAGVAASAPNRGDEMKRPDDPMREIAALRERLSKLSEASLRITEDLDLDTVRL